MSKAYNLNRNKQKSDVRKNDMFIFEGEYKNKMKDKEGESADNENKEEKNK